MTCTEQAFHYNAKGNISQAFTVTCSNAQSKKKLVFQLGMGRVRENKNGVLLSEALFAFLILLISVSLVLSMVQVFRRCQGVTIYESIEKEWFYND